MHNSTHGRHRMVKETNETINFQACFFYNMFIKTHDSESRGQEEAGRTRDEQVSYLQVAPL